jgi:hypothetical protein
MCPDMDSRHAVKNVEQIIEIKQNIYCCQILNILCKLDLIHAVCIDDAARVVAK